MTDTNTNTNTNTPLSKLGAIVDAEAYQTIIDGLKELRADFIDDNLLFSHIKALTDVMPILKKHVAARAEGLAGAAPEGV